MKNSLASLLLIPLFLVSCGKTEEVKTVESQPVNPVQIVRTGSLGESGSWKTEQTATWTTTNSWVSDEVSIKLEKWSQQYWSYLWVDDKWVKYRIGDVLRGNDDFKVHVVSLDTSFKLNSEKLGFINLFTVKNSNKFLEPKEIVGRYFIDSKYSSYCSVQSISAKKEITQINASKDFYDMAYVSENLFLNKDDWEVFHIAISNAVNSESEDEILNKWYCFWVGHSAPSSYFIFKKNDLKKFLLINTTQDPYPFNPRSFEF